MVRKIYLSLWRITAIICLLAWVIVFILEYLFLHINGNVVRDNNLFSPLVCLCIHAVMILGSAFLVAFPLKFGVYGFLCAAMGLVQIVEGGGLPGIFMFFLGMAFFHKIGFFKKNKTIKITALAILLLLGICTQYRYGDYKLAITFLHLLSIALMCFLAYILYLPELNIGKNNFFSQKTIRLPSNEFSLRDIHILEGIQKGEKYESIANKEGIATSTLKARAKILFDFLNVPDKNTFLIAFSNQSIILEDSLKELH